MSTWVVDGYDYGPIAIEVVVWIITLLASALVAILVSLMVFRGPAEELLRFVLILLALVVVTPLSIYGVAHATGYVLPSQQPAGHYSADRTSE